MCDLKNMHEKQTEINNEQTGINKKHTHEENIIQDKEIEIKNVETEKLLLEKAQAKKLLKEKRFKRKKERQIKRRTKKLQKPKKTHNFYLLGITDTTRILFSEPTNIQKLVIPHLLKQQDVIGIAKTGSGKTLSFILPILQNIDEDNYLQALIIVPTRELCHQTYFVLKQYNQKHVQIQKIIGGLVEKGEVKNLLKSQILVATPGRLLQYLMEQKDLETNNLKYLIIDEFDKMVEFGFFESLKEILNFCKTDCLSLFSATYKHEFLNENILKQKQPKLLIDHSLTNIEKHYTIMKHEQKIDNLYSILNGDEKFIIFFSTTKAAKFHFLLFEKIFNCYLLSSDCSQKSRLKSFDDFNNSGKGVLFCTDLASRGLDFKRVNVVIQFDRPDDLETFIHRSGRCGRGDSFGKVYLFLLENEKKFLEKTCEVKEIKVMRRKLNFKNMFKRNEMLKDFATKYVKTYEKYLTLNNKKYPGCVDGIIKLREFLGL
ncbi:ATP-dependent RNA helicase DBP4 [Cucumispora dikerogammari]|nr:ATP-dependent RNA helicase DBP4 [Cucumispora dikerogammari]